LFIELTSEEQLRTWLPRLVGIERSVLLRLPGGESVRCVPDEDHETQLTRDEITASVHYVRFELEAPQIDRFDVGTTLALDHDAYAHEAELGPETVAELLSDLRP
jgi:hypothetical protein